MHMYFGRKSLTFLSSVETYIALILHCSDVSRLCTCEVQVKIRKFDFLPL